MNNKIKIKIIKKGETKIPEASDPQNESKGSQTSQLTATISGWVAEFQNRRLEETESVLKRFR